jgi:hypothetical protein
MGRKNSAKSIGNRMSDRFPLSQFLQGITPPLQANPPQQGLANQFPDLRHFAVKGVKGKERLALCRRRKQNGAETITVQAPDLFGGERKERGRGHDGVTILLYQNGLLVIQQTAFR